MNMILMEEVSEMGLNIALKILALIYHVYSDVHAHACVCLLVLIQTCRSYSVTPLRFNAVV